MLVRQARYFKFKCNSHRKYIGHDENCSGIVIVFNEEKYKYYDSIYGAYVTLNEENFKSVRTLLEEITETKEILGFELLVNKEQLNYMGDRIRILKQEIQNHNEMVMVNPSERALVYQELKAARERAKLLLTINRKIKNSISNQINYGNLNPKEYRELKEIANFAYMHLSATDYFIVHVIKSMTMDLYLKESRCEFVTNILKQKDKVSVPTHDGRKTVFILTEENFKIVIENKLTFNFHKSDR